MPTFTLFCCVAFYRKLILRRYSATNNAEDKVFVERMGRIYIKEKNAKQKRHKLLQLVCAVSASVFVPERLLRRCCKRSFPECCQISVLLPESSCVPFGANLMDSPNIVTQPNMLLYPLRKNIFICFVCIQYTYNKGFCQPKFMLQR